MKTVIDYSKLEGQNKIDTALGDCRGYLEDKFDQVCDVIRDIQDKDQGLMMLSFVGIEGYPASVLYDYVHGA